MKLLILLSFFLTSHSIPSQRIADDFGMGFKYVIDNRNSFEHLTAEQFAVAVNKKFGVPENYRVRSLTQVLNDGGNTWSPTLTALLVDLNTSINDSKSFEDFIKGLTIFENNTSRLGSGERTAALNYASILRLLMNMLYEDLQHYNFCCEMEEAIPFFWPDLGKCAAGIIGGAGTGALAGAAVGAGAAGFGAPVGAIIGGIAGAFTAAATFCYGK